AHFPYTTLFRSNDGKETVHLMQSNHPIIALDHVIQFLHQLKQEYSASNQSKMTLDDMKKENHRLKQQNSDLEKKLSETRNQLHTIKEDYQVFCSNYGSRLQDDSA